MDEEKLRLIIRELRNKLNEVTGAFEAICNNQDFVWAGEFEAELINEARAVLKLASCVD